MVDKTSRIRISIHAPAKGATQKFLNDAEHLKISIHAPAKGATIALFAIPMTLLNFNPRSREGSDGNISQNIELLL